jgi:hypothetical protein
VGPVPLDHPTTTREPTPVPVPHSRAEQVSSGAAPAPSSDVLARPARFLEVRDTDAEPV